MSTMRLKYTVIIGTNELDKARLDKLIIKFNHFFGGLTYSEKMGTWNEESETSQKWYNVDGFVSETAHYFEIMTDDMNEENNLHKIKRIVSPICKNVANWIHVECQVVQGLHFSIAEFLESPESEQLLTDADRV